VVSAVYGTPPHYVCFVLKSLNGETVGFPFVNHSGIVTLDCAFVSAERLAPS